MQKDTNRREIGYTHSSQARKWRWLRLFCGSIFLQIIDISLRIKCLVSSVSIPTDIAAYHDR